MRITIQEIDEKGDALEWVAESSDDLLNIGKELLTEFEQSITLHKFKTMIATAEPFTHCAVWLVKELNALGFYKYRGVFE